jgi:hypothetical protein
LLDFPPAMPRANFDAPLPPGELALIEAGEIKHAGGKDSTWQCKNRNCRAQTTKDKKIFQTRDDFIRHMRSVNCLGPARPPAAPAMPRPPPPAAADDDDDDYDDRFDDDDDYQQQYGAGDEEEEDEEEEEEEEEEESVVDPFDEEDSEEERFYDTDEDSLAGRGLESEEEEEAEEEEEEEKEEGMEQGPWAPCAPFADLLDEHSTHKLRLLQIAQLFMEKDIKERDANDIIEYFKSLTPEELAALPNTYETILKRVTLDHRQVQVYQVPIPADVQEILGLEKPSVLFVYRDPIVVLQHMLEHSRYAQDPAKMHWEAKQETKEGKRVLTHMCTGDWWAATENEFADELEAGNDQERGYVCPVLFFTDGAHLDEKGRSSARVAMVTCGNFPNSVLTETHGRELVAIFPDLPKPQENKHKERIREAGRHLYHECMRILTKSLKACFKEGGFRARVGGKEERRLMPFTPFFVCDGLEALVITGVKGAKTDQNCWRCHVSSHRPKPPEREEGEEEQEEEAEAEDPYVVCRPRMAAAMYALLDKHASCAAAVHALDRTGTDKKTKLYKKAAKKAKDARAEVEAQSQHPDTFRCAFREMLFGAMAEAGKWGAVFPEELHQLLKGLMEKGVELLILLIRKHKGTAGVDVLDRRLKNLDPSHQSDRTSFPIKRFPRGASQNSRMFAQEYSALILLIMVALAGDANADILPRRFASLVVQAFDHLFRMWMWLGQEALDYGMMGPNGVFQQRARLCLSYYKAAFQGLDGVNFSFPKFHLLLHYWDFFRKFGCFVSASSRPYEGAIRVYLKEIYRGTNRHVREGGMTVAEQIQQKLVTRAMCMSALSWYYHPDTRKKTNFPSRCYPSSLDKGFPKGSGGCYGPAPVPRPGLTRRSSGFLARTSLWYEDEEEGERQLVLSLEGKSYFCSLLPSRLRADMLQAMKEQRQPKKPRREQAQQQHITCNAEVRMAVGGETFIIRADPSFRGGRPWRDYCVIAYKRGHTLAKVWALWTARDGVIWALLHVYRRAPQGDIEWALLKDAVGWPVMLSEERMVAPLGTVLLDTAYAMPAESPTTQLNDDIAEKAAAKEDKDKDELSRYAMLQHGDSKYVLWLDKNLYADMHPIDPNKAREIVHRPAP